MTQIIHSGKDGELLTTTEADIDRMFAGFADGAKVVLHFHGGLVPESGGRATAARLDPVYREAGATGVFFVWESGLLEVLTHNIAEIAGEDFFKIVQKYVTRYAVGKLRQQVDPGGKAIGDLKPLTETEFYLGVTARGNGREPFGQPIDGASVSELSPDEDAEFRRRLADDLDFAETVEAITRSALPEPVETRAKGAVVRSSASARTLMSPDRVAALVEDNQQAKAQGAKGVLSTARAVAAAAKILRNVVLRFRRGRDHGVYPTIVEEILREFYLANAGASIWHAMKQETADTFQPGPKPRAGSAFLDRLEAFVASGRKLEITLVGHSTGAVFINNMLRDASRRRERGTLPADFRFRNVIFLAPACTVLDFAGVIPPTRGTPLFEHLRTFAMTDQAESAEALVPFVYTRSLLYFVSGVVERDDEGESAYDRPLVGMQRYHTMTGTYTSSTEATVRAHLGGDDRRTVWSPTKAGALRGLRCGAQGHTKFDEDDPTLESMVDLIQRGYAA